MIKKRLGDLLREEAQALEPEVEIVHDAQESTPKSSERVKDNNNEQVLEVDVTLSVKEPMNEINEPLSVNKSAQPSLVELEKTISELTKAVQKAQQQENSLQEQVNSLKVELQEEKKQVKKLKTEVSHEKTIKLELEEAKKVIVQLSEVNSNLQEELNNSKQVKKDHSRQESNTSKLAPKDYNYESKHTRSPESYLTRIPEHSIRHDSEANESQQNSESNATFESEVGWFD